MTGVTKGRGCLGFLEPENSEKGPSEVGGAVGEKCGEDWKLEQLAAASGEKSSCYRDATNRHKGKAGSRESLLPPVFQSPSSASSWQSSTGNAEVSAVSQLHRVQGGFGVQTHRPNDCD